MKIGVHTLKIEGRQKGASYVHHAVTSLKKWRQAVASGKQDPVSLAEDLRDLSLVYSRGFGDGFLAGSDHQTLVEGRTPRHRGLLLGRVEKVERKRVLVGPPQAPKEGAEGVVSSPLPGLGGSTEAASGAAVAAAEPRNGMGVVFRQGDPQEQEQGGPIFSATSKGRKWWLRFGKPGPDLKRVRPGAEVYLTSDPSLLVKKVEGPEGRVALKVHVEGALGQRLKVRAELPFGPYASVESTIDLQEARKSALTEEVLCEQLGALGGTPFRLDRLIRDVGEGLFLPFAQLREMRRELVIGLSLLLERGKTREVHEGPHLPHLLRKVKPVPQAQARLVALCRNEEQLEAALKVGVPEVELDWMELVGLNAPVARAKAAGVHVGLATVRVQKPGEEAYDRRIEKLQPDWVLIRHWAGLMHFLDQKNRPILHGDFSLNVTNSLTTYHLLGLGLQTVTASHDLDQKQLFHLLDAVDPGRFTVTIHHHIPTFHTEHCVYSALLSNGRDYRTCGRPCEEHQVSLRDRIGHEHPVIVDVGCRNTVFNAQAQSAAYLVPQLMERGVARFRVEFVRESFDETQTTLMAYQDLMKGEISHQELTNQIDVHEQFGVTRGTMEVLS